MIEELYINGQEVDIEDVDIVRTYRTPFFSNVEELRQDGTYSIKLPLTSQNKVVFEHCYRDDFATDFPYNVQKASYYIDGLTIFEDAEVRVLSVERDSIEIQLVYGINREKYLPLFNRKINEIVPITGVINESDWIVNWKKSNVKYATGAKYKYLDYISGERESDVKILNGETQAKAEAPIPFKDNVKEMTMHPFVLFEDILDLIIADHNANVENTPLETDIFDPLKDRLENKGLILGGNKVDKLIEYERLFSTNTTVSGKVPLSNFQSTFFVIGATDEFGVSDKASVGVDINKLVLHLNLKTTRSGQFAIYKYNAKTLTSELIQNIPYFDNGTEYVYISEISITAESGVTYFLANTGSSTTIIGGGTLKILNQLNHAVFANYESGYDINPGQYNCLMNLPNITAAEFIQQMLIMTCMFIGHNANGDINFISFDDLVTNLTAGEVYNRSGYIGEITKNEYRFGDYAQKNIIKFNNSDDVIYESRGELLVNDLTLNKERDMYVIKFDLADRTPNGGVRFILYNQRVTEKEVTVDDEVDIETSFENRYSERQSVCVYDHSGRAIINNIVPNSYTEEEESIGMVVPIGITDEFTITSVDDTYVSVSESIAGLSGSFLLYAINSSYIWFENIIITGYSGTYIYLDTTSLGLSIGDKIQLCLQSTNKLYLEPLLYPKEVGDYITLSGNDYIITEIGVDQNEVSIATNSFYISDFSYNINITHKITGFIEKYYGIMQDIIERPRIIECEDNMDVFTSVDIKYEKPFYADELGGRYSMLLDLQAPNHEPCVCTLLLINKSL